MINLSKFYEKYIEDYEVCYLLGSCEPKKIESLDTSKIVDYFLYTYSYLGISATDFMSINDIKKDLNSNLNLIIENNPSLNINQIWWIIALLYLKLGSDYYSFYSVSSTINTLLDKSFNLKPKELMYYSNLINDTLGELINYDLRIRPSEDSSISNYNSNIYSSLIKNSSKIISILDNYFSEELFHKEEVLKEKKIVQELNYPCDIWDIIFDNLTMFICTLFENIDKEKLNIHEIVESSILDLCIESSYIEQKVSLASEEIVDLLLINP